MKLQKNNKVKPIFLLFISLFLITLILTNLKVHKSIRSTPIEISGSDKIDILKFWDNEIQRVNDTDLNIEIGEKHTLKHTNKYSGREYEFKAREITFDSPNWVDEVPSIISIHGYLIYPEDEEDVNPGCLALHGLNGDANNSFHLAYSYLERDFVVLTFSFPGHGESGGDAPAPENFQFQEDYNESSHFYLSTCSTIQALRVLENLTIVDNDNIMVIGGSYGGLNAIFLSGICGDRIQGVHVLGALGDLEEALEDPTKLIFWVIGQNAEDLPNDWWKEHVYEIDPKYYLKSDKIPPILISIGTNDEFFHYRQIKGSYGAIDHDEKFLQIYANGHHGFPDWENGSKFFIKYIAENRSAPPDIDVKKYETEYGVFGDSVKVSVEVDSDKDVKSVQVCYRYLDVVGSAWAKKELLESDDDEWEGYISPGMISSNLDYYIIVTLEGDQSYWFSSRIYTVGFVNSNFTIPFYIAISAFIILPAGYIIFKRYKKDVLEKDDTLQKKAKKLFIFELVLIGIIETLFYVSFFLPWVILESGEITWTHFYFFENIYTWERYFSFVAHFLALAFILGWIVYSHICLKKPILSGAIKVLYPIFTFGVFGLYVSRLGSPGTSSSAQVFGTGYPGLGMFLMLFCSISMIILGLWKRRYQNKLDLKKNEQEREEKV